MKKTDIVHNPNGTVSFKSSTKYVFDRDLSVGPETDKFTTVNLVAFVSIISPQFAFACMSQERQAIVNYRLRNVHVRDQNRKRAKKRDLERGT